MRRRWWILIAVAAAAGAVLTALVVAPRPAPEAGNVVALFDAPPQSDAPAYPEGTDLGLLPETVRFAGRADGRTYWIGRDALSQVCFAVTIEHTELGGASCGSTGALRERGLMFSVTGSGESFVAHLVPDDVAADAAPAPWEVVGDNVLVADPRDLGAAPLTLPREGWGDITLRR